MAELCSVYRFGVVLFGATLVACGGGGGESGGTDAPVAAPNAVAITDTNSNQVASDAFVVTNFAVSGANTATGLVAFATGSAPTPTFSLRNFAEDYLQRLRGRSSSQMVTVQAVYTDPYVCSGGGSYADAWNDVDNDLTDSAGDSYSTTYSNCVEAGITTNGAVSASLVSFSGSALGDYTMSGTFGFDNLSVSYTGLSFNMNGGMSYSASRTGTNASATVSIPSLVITEPSGSATIANATLQYLQDESTLAYSYSISATVSSTAAGGQVTVTTLTPFAGTGTGYPVSGSIRMTGAAGSSVALTATGGGNVRLDVDGNGDGITDSTTNTTWPALVAL